MCTPKFVPFDGIRDVRERVKFLVTLERNRVFAKEVHAKASGGSWMLLGLICFIWKPFVFLLPARRTL
jgi:hypothetical protein